MNHGVHSIGSSLYASTFSTSHVCWKYRCRVIIRPLDAHAMTIYITRVIEYGCSCESDTVRRTQMPSRHHTWEIIQALAYRFRSIFTQLPLPFTFVPEMSTSCDANIGPALPDARKLAPAITHVVDIKLSCITALPGSSRCPAPDHLIQVCDSLIWKSGSLFIKTTAFYEKENSALAGAASCITYYCQRIQL